MSHKMRFDHAVIMVADLERAVADYSAMGFAISPGGVHAAGATRNALIAFRDGSYIELLTFTRKLQERAIRLLDLVGLGRVLAGDGYQIEMRLRSRAAGGEGLVDFALSSDSLETDLARMRREGLRVEGPSAGGRATEAGEPVKWELGIPASPELPFLCSDVTNRSLRVPGGAATRHPNGVTGIAGITIAVESVETGSARYQALLGAAPEPVPPARADDSRGRLFSLAGAEIIVASPRSGVHPLRDHLRRRGAGPFALHLQVAGGSPLPSFDARRAHGATLVAVPETATSR